MACSIYKPGDVIDLTGAKSIGVPVSAGGRCAIPTAAIASGDNGSGYVTHIFKCPMAAVTITDGEDIWWDNNGSPVGGTALSGAATNVSGDGDVLMGKACYDQAATDSYVYVALNTSLSPADDSVTLAKMADLAQGSIIVGGAADAPTALAAETSGQILVGDGTDLKSVAVSGDATLSAAGAVTLNASHAYQRAFIAVADGGAGDDIAARPVFVAPDCGCTLVSVGILTQGAPAGVDDANTSVFVVADETGNGIVTKTYNTGTQPPTSDYESLGALSAEHKVLTAGEHVSLAITNGATADLPALTLVIVYEPTNV